MRSWVFSGALIVTAIVVVITVRVTDTVEKREALGITSGLLQDCARVR